MKKIGSIIFSVVALGLTGALIFFALRYERSAQSPLSATSVSSPQQLPPPPFTPDWHGIPFGAGSDCSVKHDSETVWLIAPKYREDGSGKSSRLVVINDQTGEWRIQANLAWFCPVRFSGSRLYGFDTIGGSGIYSAVIQSGVITTTKLDIPTDGRMSPDGNYYAFLTGKRVTKDGYYGLITGAVRAIRVLNFKTGEITVIRENSTSTYLRLLGWSLDQESIGYEISDLQPVAKGYDVKLSIDRINVSKLFPKELFRDG